MLGIQEFLVFGYVSMSQFNILRMTLFLTGIMLPFVPALHAQAGQAACTSVHLNGSGDWYPVSMRKEAGALQGIFPDLGHEIFGSLDIPVTEGPELPWKRLLTLLEFGQIDVIAGAFLTGDRKERFGVSVPVMQEEVGIFVRSDLVSKPEKLEDLVGLRGVAPFGTSFGEGFETFASQSLSVDRQPFDDHLTDMRLLTEKKADYLVIARQDGEQMIREMQAEGLVERLPWPASVNTLHYLFSKRSPCLEMLGRFNKELQRKLDGGALDRLIQRYQMTAGDG